MKIIQNPKVKIPKYYFDDVGYNELTKNYVVNLTDGWMYDEADNKARRLKLYLDYTSYQKYEKKAIDIKWFLDIKKTENLYTSINKKLSKILTKITNSIKEIGKNKKNVILWGFDKKTKEPKYYKIEWNKLKDRKYFSYRYFNIQDGPTKVYKCQRFIDFLSEQDKFIKIRGIVSRIFNMSLEFHLKEKAEELCEEYNNKNFSDYEFRLSVQEFLKDFHMLLISINGKKYRFLGDDKLRKEIELTEILA